LCFATRWRSTEQEKALCSRLPDRLVLEDHEVRSLTHCLGGRLIYLSDCVGPDSGGENRADRSNMGWLVAVLLVAAIGGCGGHQGPERVVVFGEVSYQGKPVANGLIRFVPEAGAGLPTAVASITNGKYRVDSHGGVPAGTHKVQIEGYEVPSNAQTDPMSGGLALGPPYIPETYNKQTTLTFTVPSGSGKIEKNFALD
jgi:hypothetical protein